MFVKKIQLLSGDYGSVRENEIILNRGKLISLFKSFFKLEN